MYATTKKKLYPPKFKNYPYCPASFLKALEANRKRFASPVPVGVVPSKRSPTFTGRKITGKGWVGEGKGGIFREAECSEEWLGAHAIKIRGQGIRREMFTFTVISEVLPLQRAVSGARLSERHFCAHLRPTERRKWRFPRLGGLYWNDRWLVRVC